MNDTSSCALVIGLCSHGLAISRSLHRFGIEVHAFEPNPELPGFKTRSAEVHQVTSINDEALVDHLIEFRKRIPAEKRIVLFPTNDNNVKVIAENIGEIGRHYFVSWSASAAKVKQLLLKNNIEKRCIQTGLSYPKSIIVEDMGSLDESILALREPLIVKPVKPQSGFKALKFETANSVAAGIKDYSRDFPILVQEWIAGTSEDIFFCAVFFDHGKPMYSFVGRKLDSYPPALGQTTVAVTEDNEFLIALTHRFFDGLEFSGPASLEFKRDQQGNFWVIEPTVGRSDFWLGLCVAAGFDLPLLEYQLSTARKPESRYSTSISPTIWFDSERDPLAPLRYRSRWLRLSSRAYKPVFSYFDPKDRAPFYSALMQTLLRLKSALLKKLAG